MKTLYFGGNGAAWSQHVGYMEYIKKHYRLPDMHYAGVSSGSIIASIYGLDLEPRKMMEIYRLIHGSAIDPEQGYAGQFYKCILPFLRTALCNTYHEKLKNISFMLRCQLLFPVQNMSM